MKQKNRETFFYIGITFVGVSVVFIAAVNKAIGLAFLAMGITYMIIGGRAMKKSKGKK